jgi:hypothetical protein
MIQGQDLFRTFDHCTVQRAMIFGTWFGDKRLWVLFNDGREETPQEMIGSIVHNLRAEAYLLCSSRDCVWPQTPSGWQSSPRREEFIKVMDKKMDQIFDAVSKWGEKFN